MPSGRAALPGAMNAEMTGGHSGVLDAGQSHIAQIPRILAGMELPAMSGPSPHITWAELACHDAAQTPYPHKWRTSRLLKLASVFERIRRDVGQPIEIGCAYRTPEHNRRKGGAPHSQHPQGRALDLYPPVGWTRARFHRLVKNIAHSDKRIGAIGYYSWGVHVDTRPAWAEADRLGQHDREDEAIAE